MSKIEDRPPKFELPDPSTGGCSFGLIASTRAGKTTFMKYIVNKYFDEHIRVLMCPSVHSPIYKEMDNIIKCPVYSGELIREAYDINRKTKNHYDFCFILDDVVDAKFNKDLVKLLCVYRNSKCSAVYNIQNPMLLNTSVRSNMNFVLLGKLNNDESVEKVVRMYLMTTLKGKVEEKVKQYKELTDNYHWIVVDNLSGDIFRTKINI